VQLRFVLFRKLNVDRSEVDAVFEGFLFGLHAFDFAAHASDLFLDLEYVGDFAGTLLKNGAESFFGLTIRSFPIPLSITTSRERTKLSRIGAPSQCRT